MIVLESIHKSYGSLQVLKGVDLALKAGEIHGIVGENGAGKTTLFRCLAGLESCQGSIRYDGGNRREVTGFLPTTPYFLSKITGKEYLQLMCRARHAPARDLATQNVFDLPLGQYASTYSTGMKKKLALTAILLQGNEIFILDEPFNGVDIQSNLLIREVLGKLKELGKIVVLSSHIFSVLGEVCDVLSHLKDGKIVTTAGKEEFYKIEAAMKDSGIGGRIDRLGLG